MSGSTSHPRARLRHTVGEALAAAKAYKAHHEEWFRSFSAGPKHDPRSHRASSRRFQNRMLRLDRAIAALEDMTIQSSRGAR